MTAWVASTVGDQPASAPPSPAKTKTLAAVTPPCVTGKADVELKTMPVGSNSPAALSGSDTTSDCGTPLPS